MSTPALDALLGEQVETWPVELPDHLSATQIGMWQRCREQYRRRYVLGEKERPGAALVWGKADHKAHEHNFAQKIISGEDVPVAEVEEAFAASFDSEVDKLGGASEVVWDEKPSDLKDAGVRLVGAYHRQVSPSVQPTAVEQRFEVSVPKLPVPVVGWIDLETAGSAIERKTAKAATKKVEPKWILQGLLYQAVREKPVDYHVSVKTKTPAVWTPAEAEELRLPPNERMVAATQVLVQNTAQEINAYWQTFGPEQPWTGALSHPWACRFCGWGPRGNNTCFWWGN